MGRCERYARAAAPGSDLVLLRPDGSESVLVDAGDDAVVDPFVSFDAKSVYYALTRMSDKGRPQSSDIYRVDVETGETVRLTHQEFTPNTGVVAADVRPEGVFNMGPCPLPGGKIVFTSNRNGFDSTPRGAGLRPAAFCHGRRRRQRGIDRASESRLCAASDDPARRTHHVFQPRGPGAAGLPSVGNLDDPSRRQRVGYAGQRVSSPQQLGLPLRGAALRRPDRLRGVLPQEQHGLRHVLRHGRKGAQGQPRFASADRSDPANLQFPASAEKSRERFPFSPRGLEGLTPFTHGQDQAAPNSDPKDKSSPRVGKVTHPSAAPDNHLLLVYSGGAVITKVDEQIDSGIYLLKSGQPIEEPGELLLIKNDPQYNEQWPRALVPYRRIYGIDEPNLPQPVANDGSASPHLPEGSPYGLVGGSSMYKRETYPGGVVPEGEVTARYAGGEDPFEGLGSFLYGQHNESGNWFGQGADACRYDNSEIHAVRILAMEPRTDGRLTDRSSKRFWNYAGERLRILGEVPVRKFDGDQQPIDPDGNPDTSFLVKLPADAVWTFQTLDKRGMVLNMSQTWHQVRPGEIRTNCGGCHAHSQEPTGFELTAAGRPGFKPFDLTQKTPLLTEKARDESGKKWDSEDESGLRFADRILYVEYYRHVKPILERSCVACHTKDWEKPAGELVLDDATIVGAEAGYPQNSLRGGEVPVTYARLAMDSQGRHGAKSPTGKWIMPQVSRYVRVFQSRRSLLIWKVYGERLDGWQSEDFVTESTPRDISSLQRGGQPVGLKEAGGTYNLAFHGSIMPPPEAVGGQYTGPDGQKIKVEPLSAEDRLTLARWIDLGCPIDMAYDPENPQHVGNGWMLDEVRPTLTLTHPQAGNNSKLSRLLVRHARLWHRARFEFVHRHCRFRSRLGPGGREPGAEVSTDLARRLGTEIEPTARSLGGWIADCCRTRPPGERDTDCAAVLRR